MNALKCRTFATKMLPCVYCIRLFSIVYQLQFAHTIVHYSVIHASSYYATEEDN